MIDTSEMGNRSVKLGDKVTFNCKVIITTYQMLSFKREFLYPSLKLEKGFKKIELSRLKGWMGP